MPLKCADAELVLVSMKNKKLRRKYMRIYYLENKEELKLRQRLWYKNNPEKRFAQLLKKDYGMSVAEYRKLERKQKGLCKLCKCEETHYRRLSVDHCHKTGRVRGLLCNNCNRGLGLLKDNVTVLKRAVKHLGERER